MELKSAIEERRAVKHFDPNYTIPESEVQELLRLSMLAPTSFNIQHWRPVLVEDEDLKQEIRAAAWNQPHVTEASLLFVLCADLKAYDREPKRYWQNAPQQAQDILVPMIRPFYEGNEQLQRDEAMRSVGLFAQNMMLAAKAMNYDSCPMIGFDTDKVAELIKLPQDHAIGMLIVIGKATKPAWPKPGQLPVEEILIMNTFS